MSEIWGDEDSDAPLDEDIGEDIGEEIQPAPEDVRATVNVAAQRRARTLTIACIVLFLAVVLLSVVAATLASSLNRERDARQGVERVAGEFAVALLSYDFEKLPEAKARVLALSTGKFRSEYDRAFASLQTLLTASQARSVGTVTDIFVGPVHDGTASAIAVADATSRTKTGTRRTLASYIQLDLVKVDGRWRVDGVTNLNFGQGSGAPAAAPTTTTTAPKTTKTTKR
ncbi:MAG TPA: hypothetical protein VM030_00675 [Acidimicrobiales bacterium]|nr:hypothetical protein [Acidimicrobiales bacterium]